MDFEMKCTFGMMTSIDKTFLRNKRLKNLIDIGIKTLVHISPKKGFIIPELFNMTERLPLKFDQS